MAPTFWTFAIEYALASVFVRLPILSVSCYPVLERKSLPATSSGSAHPEIAVYIEMKGGQSAARTPVIDTAAAIPAGGFLRIRVECAAVYTFLQDTIVFCPPDEIYHPPPPPLVVDEPLSFFLCQSVQQEAP